jgi:anti-anti-sigma regulatory factor
MDRGDLPDDWVKSSGASNELDDGNASGKLRYFIICLSNVEAIDLSGLHLLHTLDCALEAKGITLALASPCGPVRDRLDLMHKHMDSSDGSHEGKTSLKKRTFMTIDLAIKELQQQRAIRDVI